MKNTQRKMLLPRKIEAYCCPDDKPNHCCDEAPHTFLLSMRSFCDRSFLQCRYTLRHQGDSVALAESQSGAFQCI